MSNAGQSASLTDTQVGRSSRSGRRPNEEAIFTASLSAFGELGFHGASMREIAARAGTSLANLYNYVPAKADLLARVLRVANDHLLRDLSDAVDEASPHVQQLRALVEAYTLWSARNRTAGIVAMSEFRYLSGKQRVDVVAARDQTEQMFTETVLAGVASGEFQTPCPRQAARNIVLLCSAFASWYQPGGASSPEEMAASQARLALAMVEVVQMP